MRVVLRSALFSTIAFTLSLFLASCGSVTNPTDGSNTSSGTGAVPSVVGQAIEVNGVAPNRKQEVQFSEAMNPDTISAKSFLVTDAGGNQVTGTVTYDADYNVAMFQPTPALETGTAYTATITTGAQSVGGRSLAANYSWSFTTRADTDSSPLTVTNVVPAANAQCVSPMTAINITFNEAPDASTVTTANIVVTDSTGNKIPVTLSTNISTTQVTVTPKSPLPSGNITVAVSGIADLADVAMQQPYTWTFSTACNGGGGTATVSAYVYVSQKTSSSSPGQILAYVADMNGQLTPVPGSPFNADVHSIAVSANAAYLMAATLSDINSYRIGSDGSLSLAAQTNYQQFASTCAAAGGVFFDRTGQSLYLPEGNFDCSQNNGLASFAVDASTGNLNFLGDDNLGFSFSPGDLAGEGDHFTGNDVYAYTTVGSIPEAPIRSSDEFVRSSSGLLSQNSSIHLSPPAPGGNVANYIPRLNTADSTNHLAIAEQGYAASYTSALPVQLAAYTVDANGNLTTTDTYATMPTISMSPSAVAISPSGRLLAVAGGPGLQGTGAGLQVFHFNGANSITSYTSLLTTDSMGKLFWDNNNHLYAITSGAGQNPGKLYVFTVTDTTATQAPGSPYTIGISSDLAVQPK